MSTKLPPGMVSPCEAANPSAAVCQGDKNRDCRLITASDEAWISDDYTVIINEDGIAAVSGFPNVSGQWYTLNNRSFNVVTKNGTKTYAYYVFSEDELTMISDDGIPYRLYRRHLFAFPSHTWHWHSRFRKKRDKEQRYTNHHRSHYPSSQHQCA